MVNLTLQIFNLFPIMPHPLLHSINNKNIRIQTNIFVIIDFLKSIEKSARLTWTLTIDPHVKELLIHKVLHTY